MGWDFQTLALLVYHLKLCERWIKLIFLWTNLWSFAQQHCCGLVLSNSGLGVSPEIL